jgi:glyoxylate reductase
VHRSSKHTRPKTRIRGPHYHASGACYRLPVTSQVISSAHLPIDIRPILGELSYSEPAEGQLTRDELLNGLPRAQALISLLNVRVDEELIARAGELKVVANFAVGYDNIDLAHATECGIVVTNTPDVLTNATADFAFTLLLASARRLGEGERMLRAGKWKGWAPGLLLGTELSGRSLGVVGAGRIGCAVLARAKGFGMKLCYAGPRDVESAELLGASRVDVDELFSQSDFVSLHCPLNEATRKLVNRERLGKMKASAILINTARGACVDHEALADALESGALAGAGLDVFEDEPQVPSRLLECDRAVLAPHIASATLAARGKMAEICARAVRDVLAGMCPQTALNPEAMA